MSSGGRGGARRPQANKGSDNQKSVDAKPAIETVTENPVIQDWSKESHTSPSEAQVVQEVVQSPTVEVKKKSVTEFDRAVALAWEEVLPKNLTKDQLLMMVIRRAEEEKNLDYALGCERILKKVNREFNETPRHNNNRQNNIHDSTANQKSPNNNFRNNKPKPAANQEDDFQDVEVQHQPSLATDGFRGRGGAPRNNNGRGYFENKSSTDNNNFGSRGDNNFTPRGGRGGSAPFRGRGGFKKDNNYPPLN